MSSESFSLLTLLWVTGTSYFFIMHYVANAHCHMGMHHHSFKGFFCNCMNYCMILEQWAQPIIPLKPSTMTRFILFFMEWERHKYQSQHNKSYLLCSFTDGLVVLGRLLGSLRGSAEQQWTKQASRRHRGGINIEDGNNAENNMHRCTKHRNVNHISKGSYLSLKFSLKEIKNWSTKELVFSIQVVFGYRLDSFLELVIQTIHIQTWSVVCDHFLLSNTYIRDHLCYKNTTSSSLFLHLWILLFDRFDCMHLWHWYHLLQQQIDVAKLTCVLYCGIIICWIGHIAEITQKKATQWIYRKWTCVLSLVVETITGHVRGEKDKSAAMIITKIYKSNLCWETPWQETNLQQDTVYTCIEWETISFGTLPFGGNNDGI